MITPMEERPVMEETHAQLEIALMEEYLGRPLHSLAELPAKEAARLRTEASRYASTRLAEIEARAGLVRHVAGAAAQSTTVAA
ncbi:MAG: hypothetical protein ACUVR4_12865 [Anaerolineae bacterium]